MTGASQLRIAQPHGELTGEGQVQLAAAPPFQSPAQVLHRRFRRPDSSSVRDFEIGGDGGVQPYGLAKEGERLLLLAGLQQPAARRTGRPWPIRRR